MISLDHPILRDYLTLWPRTPKPAQINPALIEEIERQTGYRYDGLHVTSIRHSLQTDGPLILDIEPVGDDPPS